MTVWWAIDRVGGEPLVSLGGEQGVVTSQAATTRSASTVSTPPAVSAPSISSSDSATSDTPPPTATVIGSTAQPDGCPSTGGATGPGPTPESGAPLADQAPRLARVTADYRFENTLINSVGPGTELSAIGAADASGFIDEVVLGQLQPVLAFDRGSGLVLTPASAVIGSEYTIELLFRFDRLSGYVKIVDFNDATQDCGLYSLDGRMDFWPIVSGSRAALQADSYAHVVLTRDLTGTVVTYVNGLRQLSFRDAGDVAVIDTNDTLRLFSDDRVTPNEDSGGAVSRVRIYDAPLTAGQVTALAAEFPIALSPSPASNVAAI